MGIGQSSHFSTCRAGALGPHRVNVVSIGLSPLFLDKNSFDLSLYFPSFETIRIVNSHHPIRTCTRRPPTVENHLDPSSFFIEISKLHGALSNPLPPIPLHFQTFTLVPGAKNSEAFGDRPATLLVTSLYLHKAPFNVFCPLQSHKADTVKPEKPSSKLWRRLQLQLPFTTLELGKVHQTICSRKARSGAIHPS